MSVWSCTGHNFRAVKDQISDFLKPTLGVKQGDNLSDLTSTLMT